MCAQIHSSASLSRHEKTGNTPAKHAEVYGKACGGSSRTLVWTNGGIELYAVAAVDVLLTLLVPPGYAESNHALRLDQARLKASQSSSQHAVNRSAEG